MARPIQPYEAVNPSSPFDPGRLGQEGDRNPDIVVGGAPTLATRQKHGYDYWRGISVAGIMGAVVPVAPVHADMQSVSMPYVQPSTVAPDLIKPSLFTTQNNYSPVSHSETRAQFSKTLPAPASLPLTKMPGVNNASRRPSGAAFTIPYPLGVAQWPNAAQWLASRMSENQV